MERLIFLVISAIILFLSAIVGSLLPLYFSRKGKDYSHLYHIGNTLSGGVMLSAGFCHLLVSLLGPCCDQLSHARTHSACML